MKLGHMTPPSVCRHLPTPTQRVVACAHEPLSLRNAKCDLTCGGLNVSGPSRMFESSGYGSTTLPGFIFQPPSQIDLNSRNASTSSGPNIFGSSSPRDCPSPCSPEIDPPKETTRSAASSTNERYLASPG